MLGKSESQYYFTLWREAVIPHSQQLNLTLWGWKLSPLCRSHLPGSSGSRREGGLQARDPGTREPPGSELLGFLSDLLYQKKALSCPTRIADPNGKTKDSSSLLARAQPMKTHKLFIYSSPPSCLFSSIKKFSFPSHLRTCMWLHGCRPQTAVLC